MSIVVTTLTLSTPSAANLRCSLSGNARATFCVRPAAICDWLVAICVEPINIVTVAVQARAVAAQPTCTTAEPFGSTVAESSSAAGGGGVAGAFGVTAVEALDAAPVPTALVARTVNV